ncbi:MAG: hypothetical protein GWQ05_00285 [Verrucomicrobiaceae bacterium]|nr:hypothetical protein [Verrucomicrobiaceae bacterium]NCF89393.1 hypothetical protein [Verrucomicrobiaceae bacterium]
MRLLLLYFVAQISVYAADSPLSIQWEKEYLTITHSQLPDQPIRIHYLEAFCRPGSSDRDWKETVIPHSTTQLESKEPGTVSLKQRLGDGVIVTHLIKAAADGVSFEVSAHNPAKHVSEAHWAQPCMRVDRFVGLPMVSSGEHYLPKCFLFLNDTLTRMPTASWAKTARYIPGQVWCAPGVNRNDVNPRPLHPDTPSNALIGCFSSDKKWILAMAWYPYQELFQGVITCLHSDFRIGGLRPGETKEIFGRVYLIEGDEKDLLNAYERDFGSKKL